MDLPIDAHDIEYAENFLVTGDLATAVPLLEKLVQMLEEYVEAECSDTSKTQWFSFADPFERLAPPSAPARAGRARCGGTPSAQRGRRS